MTSHTPPGVRVPSSFHLLTLCCPCVQSPEATEALGFLAPHFSLEGMVLMVVVLLSLRRCHHRHHPTSPPIHLTPLRRYTITCCKMRSRSSLLSPSGASQAPRAEAQSLLHGLSHPGPIAPLQLGRPLLPASSALAMSHQPLRTATENDLRSAPPVCAAFF